MYTCRRKYAIATPATPDDGHQDRDRPPFRLTRRAGQGERHGLSGRQERGGG